MKSKDEIYVMGLHAYKSRLLKELDEHIQACRDNEIDLEEFEILVNQSRRAFDKIENQLEEYKHKFIKQG